MSEWVETTIGEIAEVVGGGTPSTKEPSYWGGDVLWLTPGELTKQEGRIVTTTERRISAAGLAHSSAKMLPKDTVLLTSRATIGAVGLAGQPMATNQGFQSLIVGERVLPGFLMRWVQANKDEFTSRASGSTFPEISGKKIKAISITIPPLAEQRRIVDVMAAVDAQIEALAEEVDETGRALSALRRKLGDLGDKVPLSAMATEGGIQIGPFGSQLHAYEYTEDPDGVPVVMPQDLVNGEIVTDKIKRVPPVVTERLSRHRLQAGDIVFPRRGDLTKRALVTDDQVGWLCGTGCLRFRAANVSSAARLAEAMATDQTSDWLIEHAVGTTMLNLNTEILSKLPVADISAHPELADACTQVQSLLRESLSELVALRSFRSNFLTALLNQEISIPKSYDRLLEPATVGAG